MALAMPTTHNVMKDHRVVANKMQTSPTLRTGAYIVVPNKILTRELDAGVSMSAYCLGTCDDPTHHSRAGNDVIPQVAIVDLCTRLRLLKKKVSTWSELRTHIDSIPWISAPDEPWNHRSRSRIGAPAARDLDLRTTDVELRRRSGVVKPQLLDSEEVFAVGDAFRNVTRVRDWTVFSG